MRRENINKSIFAKSIMLILIVLFWTQLNALARSGCCSHHGGVCGCGCCDGSSLSSTCAPYYPSCNNSVSPVKTPKPPAKMYTQSQYNNLVAEKQKIKKENTHLQDEKEKINNEKEIINAELETIKEEKEALKKENENLKNKLAQLNTTKTSILGDLKDSKNNSTKSTNPQKENPSKKSNSSGNNFLTFLLGGGFMYGLSRLKRRSELKKEGVQIKGNITRDGQKIYYAPDNRYYDMVKIDKKKGERWFLSEQEAIDSGWHKV